MSEDLRFIEIKDFTTEKGVLFSRIPLSYQVFGQELGTAPVVQINHALTGNSNVAGERGWWKQLLEEVVDFDSYTILAFNIPGNGYDGFLIEDYQSFVSKDIAKLFIQALDFLEIDKLYAVMGGSLGGGLAWEMCALRPQLSEHLIPIASDWKSTDWLIANCFIQEQFLLHSDRPVYHARMHAMMCYRSPESYKAKFNRSINEELKVFNVESWLMHHGKKLQQRFQVGAYTMMNHLLKTIEAVNPDNWEEELSRITAKIHIVAVDSDLFFTPSENKETYEALHKKIGAQITYHEIRSIHGHDAFLIEYDQLKKIVAPIFRKL